MAQTAMDAARSSLILNNNLPVAAGGVPGVTSATLAATAMKLRLHSSASSGASAGTEIANGGGYTTGGIASTTASTPSSAGSSVTLPTGTSPFTWTNSSGGSWSLVSLELTDGSSGRVWFGLWTSQPIVVGIGNTFAVAAAAITAGGF